jgi:hypothetical protein
MTQTLAALPIPVAAVTLADPCKPAPPRVLVSTARPTAAAAISRSPACQRLGDALAPRRGGPIDLRLIHREAGALFKRFGFLSFRSGRSVAAMTLSPRSYLIRLLLKLSEQRYG